MNQIILSTSFLFFSLLFLIPQTNQPDQRAKNAGFEFIKDVKLSGGTTRFDYQCFDANKRRVYLAHMGSDMVTVYDVDAGKIIKDIEHVQNVHGIIAVPKMHRVYATATGKDEVAVIDENSLEIIARVPVGDYPDGLAFEPGTKRIFVSDEHGETVSVIDAVNNKFLKNIKIGGEVGNTHYDSTSGLIYSADQTNNKLIAIDPKQMKIVKRYNLPGCEGAHGFYIDEQTHYALITGEDNASFVALDLTDGKIVTKDIIGRSPDVLDFDKEKHKLVISSESGMVSIFKVDPGKVTKTGESFFYSNAHSVCIDQKNHLVFFPLKNVNGFPVLRIMKLL